MRLLMRGRVGYVEYNLLFALGCCGKSFLSTTSALIDSFNHWSWRCKSI
jgi:hypothetical protein